MSDKLKQKWGEDALRTLSTAISTAILELWQLNDAVRSGKFDANWLERKKEDVRHRIDQVEFAAKNLTEQEKSGLVDVGSEDARILKGRVNENMALLLEEGKKSKALGEREAARQGG